MVTPYSHEIPFSIREILSSEMSFSVVDADEHACHYRRETFTHVESLAVIASSGQECDH